MFVSFFIKILFIKSSLDIDGIQDKLIAGCTAHQADHARFAHIMIISR